MGAMDVLKKWDFYKKIPEVRASVCLLSVGCLLGSLTLSLFL